MKSSTQRKGIAKKDLIYTYLSVVLYLMREEIDMSFVHSSGSQNCLNCYGNVYHSGFLVTLMPVFFFLLVTFGRSFVFYAPPITRKLPENKFK